MWLSGSRKGVDQPACHLWFSVHQQLPGIPSLLLRLKAPSSFSNAYIWFIRQQMPTFSFWTSKSIFPSSFHPRSYQAPILNSAFLSMPWWTFINCSCLCQQSLCPLVRFPSAISMLMPSLSRKESHNQTWLSLYSLHIWMPVFFHSAFSDMAFTHNTWWQGPLCNL